MKAKAAVWGNSIGVRLPAALAADVGIKAGTEVAVTREGRALKIVPKPSPRYTLKGLLAGLNKKNLHGETSTGPAVGVEVID